MNNCLLLLMLLFSNCSGNASTSNDQRIAPIPMSTTTPVDTTIQTIHVLVALCDNKYQGIIPVPKGIGNGQDPASNLYWGCDWGVKAFFKKSKEWKLVRSEKKDSILMERLVFKHATKNCYLIADAYNGKYIQQCTERFLQSCAGSTKDTILFQNKTLGINGNASLVAYIGHDGLMDFRLPNVYKNADGKTRDCIILACASKQYFSAYIKNAKANPLVWTTDLMCPEAYTLHDALTAYLNKEPQEAVRSKASQAYAQYQKCSVKAARNLLVTGW